MKTTKETIDTIIKNFQSEKDSLTIDKKYLTRFDTNNEEHVACLSYINGTGGYYMKFLNNLVTKLDLKEVVELGNQTGMSTVALYAAIKKNNAHLYTIDVEKDQRFCPPEMFTDSQVSFLFGDVCSYEIIKQLPKNIDLLFTDTLHYNFQLEDEFEVYQHLLADTALVAIDDIRSNDKGILFDKLPYAKWDLTELCHASGWGLFLFTRNEEISESEREKRIFISLCKVWERKYKRAQSELDVKSVTLWKQVRTILKKAKPIYKIYTKIYNALHARFFREKVLFYER